MSAESDARRIARTARTTLTIEEVERVQGVPGELLVLGAMCHLRHTGASPMALRILELALMEMQYVPPGPSA